jgi:hypothetical protein
LAAVPARAGPASSVLTPPNCRTAGAIGRQYP